MKPVWNIGAPGDDGCHIGNGGTKAVKAILDENGTLTISGTGDMIIGG